MRRVTDASGIGSFRSVVDAIGTGGSCSSPCEEENGLSTLPGQSLRTPFSPPMSLVNGPTTAGRSEIQCIANWGDDGDLIPKSNRHST